MLINLERICNSIRSLVSNEAFFENERCILLHILHSSVFLSLFIYDDIQLFYRLLVLSIQLNMHPYHFSRLPSNHIIQLSGEVLRGETKVLGQHNVAKNVLSIRSLNGILVLPRQVFVHSPRLKVEQLIEIVMQLK